MSWAPCHRAAEGVPGRRGPGGQEHCRPGFPTNTPKLSTPNGLEVATPTHDCQKRRGGSGPWRRGPLASPEPCLTGTDDCLGSIGDLQFRKDVRDVIADGFWTQLEAPGNLGVGLVLGDQGKDLVLPLGELGKGVRLSARPGNGEVIDQALGDDRAEDGLSAGHRPDRAQNLRLESSLQQVTTSTRL